MGGGKGSGMNIETPYNPMPDLAAWQAMQLAQKYDAQTEPFRQGLMADYGQLRSEDFDPTNLPGYKQAFGLQKQSLESQYQQARRNLMGSVPQGGNLAGALTGLEANRATQMGAMPAATALPIMQDIRQRAENAGFQMPSTTLGGMTGLAGSLQNAQAMTQNAALQAQSNQYAADQSIYNAALGGIGSGIGKGISRGVGKATGAK